MDPTDERLLATLRRLEGDSSAAWVRFTDGGLIHLRVTSTAHTEAGGDVVAQVVRDASPGAVRIVAGGYMNLRLADVERVSTESGDLFRRDVSG